MATQNVRLSPWPFFFLLQLSIPTTKHASTALVYTDQDYWETQIIQDYWICILQYSQAIRQYDLQSNLVQQDITIFLEYIKHRLNAIHITSELVGVPKVV